MTTAEIKIKLFQEIDSLPEQFLPDLQSLVEKYVTQKMAARRKKTRKLGTLKGLVLHMAPDFNAPVADMAEYMD